MLLRFALIFLLLSLVIFTLALLIFGGCNHVSLLLHPVGLFALARTLLGAFTSYSTELFVALDELIKRLIIHGVVHSSLILLWLAVKFELNICCIGPRTDAKL